MLPEELGIFCIAFIICCYNPAFAASYIFGCVKRKPSYIAIASCLFAVKLCVNCLACILNNREVMAFGYFFNLPIIAKLAVQVYSHNGFCLFCYFFLYLFRIDVKCSLVNVCEYRPCLLH